MAHQVDWKREWGEPVQDLRSLCIRMPGIVRFETKENRKEGYQEIQAVFRNIYDQTVWLDPAEADSAEELSWYLLALSRTIPEIDEEVYDHRMNLVRQYRSTLRRALPFYASFSAEAQQRVQESIRSACREKILIAEKYTAYC